MSEMTSGRLTELLRMRRFIDAEIREERQRIAGDNTAGVLQAAADLYGTTMEEVRTGSNERSAVRARLIACWMLRESGKSFPEIGRILGRDHSSVMHACKVIAADPPRLALARRLLEEESAA